MKKIAITTNHWLHACRSGAVTTIVLILLCTVSVFAQDNVQYRRFVKTDLVSYLPSLQFNSGKTNVEFEQAVTNRASLAFDAGYVYSYGPSRPAGWIDFSLEQQHTAGFIVGLEYRTFYGRNRIWEPLCLLIWPLVLQLNGTEQQFGGLYTSVQLSHQQTMTSVTHSGGIAIPHPFVVTKAQPILAARIGFQSVSPRRIVIDQSLGIGVSYPMVWSEREFDDAFISLWYPSKFMGVYPFVNYSFKVGFAL